MPVNLYTEEEVEVYTRALARAYNMIRDEPATNEARLNALKEIEKVLGWKSPPPMAAKPSEGLPRDPRFAVPGSTAT